MRTAKAFAVVFVTIGTKAHAKKLATRIVRSGLAACVNIIPGIQSIYSWKREIQDDPEVLMLIKTRNSKLSALELLIRKNHPYDVPEILSVSPNHGSSPYLSWLSQETVSKRRSK